MGDTVGGHNDGQFRLRQQQEPTRSWAKLDSEFWLHTASIPVGVIFASTGMQGRGEISVAAGMARGPRAVFETAQDTALVSSGNSVTGTHANACIP